MEIDPRIAANALIAVLQLTRKANTLFDRKNKKYPGMQTRFHRQIGFYIGVDVIRHDNISQVEPGFDSCGRLCADATCQERKDENKRNTKHVQ